LREWASRIQPPRWQQIWQNTGGLAFFIWVIVMLIALDISDSHRQDANYFKQQGNDLLNNGLRTAEDQRRALEILLSLQSDRIAPVLPRSSSSSKRFLVFGFGSFLVMLIASFPPGIVIGVGRGKQRLELWRWWIKFVSITVPGFFITTFFFPYLTALIRKLVL
jgi:hypothetical protein